MDILIIKPYWADRIFDYNKLWEIRGSNTSKRGRIAIAKSGTGHIFGTANIIDSIPLTREIWETNEKNHQIELTWEELLCIYKKPYAWIFEYGSIEKCQIPVPYTHPKGAVIWVQDDSFKEQCRGE